MRGQWEPAHFFYDSLFGRISLVDPLTINFACRRKFMQFIMVELEKERKIVETVFEKLYTF